MQRRGRYALGYETNNYSRALAGYFSEPLERCPTLEEQLGAAADCGFSHVVLDRGSIEDYLEDRRSADSLKALLRDMGLRCLAVADLAIRADADEVFVAAQPLIDIASRIEAQFIQAGVFCPLDEAAPVLQALESLLTGSPLRVALEFLPFSPLDSLSTARKLIQEYSLSRTLILLDNWHFFHGPDTWQALLDTSPQELAYIQFSDHDTFRSDDILRETVNHRLLPGEGSLELDLFCECVKHTGFQGVVSVEVLSNTTRHWPPRRFAEAEYRAASPFWN